MAKIVKQSHWGLPKTLFALSPCRIPKAKGSEDLLSRSPVHAGARDEIGYDGGAAARKRQNSSFCNSSSVL